MLSLVFQISTPSSLSLGEVPEPEDAIDRLAARRGLSRSEFLTQFPAVDPDLAEAEINAGMWRTADDGTHIRAENWLDIRHVIYAGKPTPVPVFAAD